MEIKVTRDPFLYTVEVDGQFVSSCGHGVIGDCVFEIAQRHKDVRVLYVDNRSAL